MQNILQWVYINVGEWSRRKNDYSWIQLLYIYCRFMRLTFLEMPNHVRKTKGVVCVLFNLHLIKLLPYVVVFLDTVMPFYRFPKFNFHFIFTVHLMSNWKYIGNVLIESILCRMLTLNINCILYRIILSQCWMEITDERSLNLWCKTSYYNFCKSFKGK